MYLDRLSVKLLPAGGLIWTPNPDVKFDFVFPYPKFAERINNVGNSEFGPIWLREYGGGQWSVVHNNGSRRRLQLQRHARHAGPGVPRPAFAAMWKSAASSTATLSTAYGQRRQSRQHDDVPQRPGVLAGISRCLPRSRQPQVSLHLVRGHKRRNRRAFQCTSLVAKFGRNNIQF